jgi:tetratricopeptide (TPR) repeat protein
MPIMKTRPTSILGLALVLLATFVAGCTTEEREVTTTSDLAYDSYQEGRAAFERFRLEEARDHYREATEHDPEFAMAWAHLAILQSRLGEKEGALESIRRANEAREATTEVESLWIARVNSFFERDYEAGDALTEELIEKYPDHEWVLRLRAEIAKQNNDFEAAMQCYDQLLERDPESVSVHNLKGYLCLQQGDYEQAVLHLQRYAYYAPEQANPHDSLGEAYLYIGRYEEAIEEFRTALEIDPAFLWSARNMAEALSITGQSNAAIKVLKNFRPLFEERGMTSWWDMTRALVVFRAERWEELLEITDGNLERLAKLGDQEKFEYELTARYVRTIALLELGRDEAAQEAVAELERVAQKMHDFGSMAYLERPQQLMAINEAIVIARFDRAAGIPADGIEALAKAIDVATLSPHELAYPVHELAMTYLEAGQLQQAAEAAQSILEVIPTAPGLNLVAAKAHAAAGNRDAALGLLQTYLDVMRNADPGHPGVTEATALVEQLTPRS